MFEVLREELLADAFLKDCYTKESNAWMKEARISLGFERRPARGRRYRRLAAPYH